MGTVNADVNGQTLVLQTNPKTNQNLMQASNGATLDLNGIAVTNTGGTILAGDASAVNPTTVPPSPAAQSNLPAAASSRTPPALPRSLV